MSYARFFMPLIQEAKGYEFKGRPPTGRCIVEERSNTGKLSVWVQDLMPETKYSIYLIFPQAQQYLGLHMGLLDVDAKGKAEFRQEIEHLHNFALKEMTAVAIVAADAAGMVSPLCGYRSTPVSWRHNFSVWKKEAPATAPPMPAPVVEKTQTIEPEPLPVETEPQAVLEEPTPVIEAEPPHMEIEPLPIEPEPSVETPSPPPSPPRAAKPPSFAAPSPDTSLEAPDPHHVRTSTIQLIEAIFNANTPCEPFATQENEINWVRCNRPEQMPLPNDSPHLMSEPFMQAAWADHEHFILGITIGTEPAQYVIGIPGTYTQGNKAIAKRLGFSKFKCMKKDRPGIGSEGYWLMFVDL